jgi:hypothetical protein
MKKLWFVLVFSVAFISGCTPKYGIASAKAYVRENVAGTIQVDRNGVPKNSGVSRTHLIYIETVADKPQPVWSNVWIDGKPFNITPVEIKATSQNIGKTNDDKDVIISSKNGHQLWQLTVGTTSTQFPDSSLNEKIKQYPIVLTGLWREKPFTYPISKELQLATSFAQ